MLKNISMSIPVRQNYAQSEQARPMNPVLMHYERRGVVAKAAIWGILVTFVGVSLDYFVSLLGWAWLQERFVEKRD
jgi:hypothetical protein